MITKENVKLIAMVIAGTLVALTIHQTLIAPSIAKAKTKSDAKKALDIKK
jgi:predicted SnoaL-like aldol condensation-catalyzing enzyme